MKINSSLANHLRLSSCLALATLAFSVGNAVAATPEIVNQTSGLNITFFDWDLNANSTIQNGTIPIYDQVISDSSSNKLTGSGPFNVFLGAGVDLSNTFWNSNQSWTVFSAFNPSTSTFLNTVTQPTGLSPARPGASFSLSPLSAGVVTLNYTTAAFVPEPTSAFAGLLLTAGLLRRKRR